MLSLHFFLYKFWNLIYNIQGNIFFWRNSMLYKDKYNEWLESEIIDEAIKNELRVIEDEKEI